MYNFVDNFLILLHNLNVFCAVVMDNVNGSCQLISATAQDWMQRFVRRVSRFQRGLSVPIRVNYAFFPRVLQLSICVGWVVSRQPIVRKGLANCWLVPVSWTSGQMMRFFVGLDGLWGFFYINDCYNDRTFGLKYVKLFNHLSHIVVNEWLTLNVFIVTCLILTFHASVQPERNKRKLMTKRPITLI